MRILHLVLKKKWFDMIDAGIKKEEYRDMTPHWWSRLLDRPATNRLHGVGYGVHYVFKEFDVVCFHHGYQPDAPLTEWEFKGIEVKTGNPEWGAEPGKEYLTIKLGRKLIPQTI